jgi:hypothetical protein
MPTKRKRRTKPNLPTKDAKKMTELPADEVMKRVFSPKVVEAAKKVAHRKDEGE